MQIRTLFVISLVILFIAGCGRFRFGGDVFVPDMATADEQFALAQRKEKDLLLTQKESERHKEQMHELTQAYRKVVDLFPEDRKVTPWARIRLSQLYKENGENRRALKTVEDVLTDYSDLPMVDAKARYMKGRILEGMGERLESQQIYRDCMERYKTSEDVEVKRIAGDCEKLYERVLTLSAE